MPRTLPPLPRTPLPFTILREWVDSERIECAEVVGRFAGYVGALEVLRARRKESARHPEYRNRYTLFQTVKGKRRRIEDCG